jgi:hypothetical protein
MQSQGAARSSALAIARWNPRQTSSKQEEVLRHRLGRTRQWLAFLRAQRHELFDHAFPAALAGREREAGAGKVPVPPAM